MAGTWLEARSVTFFFWQNFRIFVRKSVFCYRTPDFGNGPFVALAKAVDLAPSDPFLNFSFPSYGRFREGDPPTQQKVLPHLTVGALTDSNSPCALRALALRARALRARAGLTAIAAPFNWRHDDTIGVSWDQYIELFQIYSCLAMSSLT